MIDLASDRQRLPSARGRNATGPNRSESGRSVSRRTVLLMMARTRTDGCNLFDRFPLPLLVDGEGRKGRINWERGSCLVRLIGYTVGLVSSEMCSSIGLQCVRRYLTTACFQRRHRPIRALEIFQCNAMQIMQCNNNFIYTVPPKNVPHVVGYNFVRS